MPVGFWGKYFTLLIRSEEPSKNFTVENFTGKNAFVDG
jgi:hypothetical protein